MKKMTELERMLAGKMYYPGDEELLQIRRRAHRLCRLYNEAFEENEPQREGLLRRLLPHAGEDVYLQGPIQFDYGVNTIIGRDFYANFNLTVLDSAAVTIGERVQFGPNVTLVTPVHPLRASDRCERPWSDGREGMLEYALPIEIGDDCWLASNVTVVGGCRIGEGSVIGAGSVVTRDIPPNVLAAGVPCRVLRSITEADAIERRTELFD